MGMLKVPALQVMDKSPAVGEYPLAHVGVHVDPEVIEEEQEDE